MHIKKAPELTTTFIQYILKKGRKESTEKRTSKLMLRLKKEFNQNPKEIFAKALNNHKVRLSITKEMKILPPLKQLKAGISNIRKKLYENILDGLKKRGPSFDKKRMLYREAIQYRFNKKRFKK